MKLIEFRQLISEMTAKGLVDDDAHLVFVDSEGMEYNLDAHLILPDTIYLAEQFDDITAALDYYSDDEDGPDDDDDTDGVGAPTAEDMQRVSCDMQDTPAVTTETSFHEEF